MTDLPTVQALIDAHKAAMQRYDDLPDGDVPDEVDAEMTKAAEALCTYRPATIEGVHRKAEYMMSCDVFVGGESGEPEFTQAQLISGFLPVGA
ncbi:hypothetical protein N181_09865 [Sinorhizobium fredii USDA 205]|uniref:Uncharacterized protein n=1 Tax=Rhizobium fredii TaxID=380 RepID=A0A844A688_RHIFR|nr:hypothetical protein [Sinorhizobium fredii]KSV90963.1 hypothetical protein N181_09865 [Sinorhizobium fredii USDA 205]MQX08639.1 hypothetical protein [Sinorhizobium fredii]GEC30506.1 hypothetical protein EFR01_06770 [Sinorhizobium fredii]GLS09703.1 hypothetical protein GCM10007864_33340 [Sinorhizobium fredii]